MIMRTKTRLLSSLLLAAVCLTFSTPLFAARKNRDCIGVVAGSPQKSWAGGKDADEREFGWPSAPTFSATGIMDLELAIIFSKSVAAQFNGVHFVEFRLYTPQGQLYESLSIPMTTDPRRAGERHRVPGYPDLVPVRVLKSINRGGGQGMFAKVTIPVAGTMIISNSLYGAWKAQAFVEDEIAPCTQLAQFTLTE